MQMDLYGPYKSPHTISWGNFNFPRSTNKIQFLMKFPHLEKIVDLIKALKYEHQSILPLWGRVKLNFRDRYRKPNIYFNNSSCYQFFSSNSQKLSLCCKKKNHSSPIWICMTHIWSPTLFPRGIMTFQGVLTKFNFLTKFPHLEKNCQFNEIPKI